jgi:beta-1,4-mannosyltransferase
MESAGMDERRTTGLVRVLGSGSPMRAVSLPPALDDNPYPRLLQEALAARGVETVAGAARPTWVLRCGRGVDVAHLHWIELYVNTRGGLAQRFPPLSGPIYVLRAARLLAALALLRLTGAGLVWTVHNVRPHEQRFPRLDRLVTRAVAALSSGLVVHSDFARRRLQREYPWLRRPVWVAPHGNYVGSYPEAGRDRSELRAGLGIPDDAFVFLIFGQLRPYKRVDEAIRAFRALPGDAAHLLVAGAPFDEGVRERIQTAAGGDPQVHLRLGFVDDADVAALHVAADAAVIAYPEVFSSGALLLALSLGLPVVAPLESAAPEIASRPALEGFEPGGLTAALEAMAAASAEDRRSAAKAAADRQGWDRAAERVHAAYRGEEPDSGPGRRGSAAYDEASR